MIYKKKARRVGRIGFIDPVQSGFKLVFSGEICMSFASLLQ